MPPHSVADDEQAELRIKEEGVLVVVALLPNVCLAFGDDMHDRCPLRGTLHRGPTRGQTRVLGRARLSASGAVSRPSRAAPGARARRAPDARTARRTSTRGPAHARAASRPGGARRGA